MQQGLAKSEEGWWHQAGSQQKQRPAWVRMSNGSAPAGAASPVVRDEQLPQAVGIVHAALQLGRGAAVIVAPDEQSLFAPRLPALASLRVWVVWRGHAGVGDEGRGIGHLRSSLWQHACRGL